MSSFYLVENFGKSVEKIDQVCGKPVENVWKSSLNYKKCKTCGTEKKWVNFAA